MDRRVPVIRAVKNFHSRLKSKLNLPIGEPLDDGKIGIRCSL